MASLDSEVRRVLGQLQVASAAATDCTDMMRDADLARSRMEDACTTLKVCHVLAFLAAADQYNPPY